VNYASKILGRVSDKLLMAYSDDNELFELSEQVDKYIWKTEDLMWDYEKTE
jgi:hypothetical protein